MIRYNLGELAKGKTRRKRVKLRPIQAPYKYKVEYRRELHEFLDELFAEVTRSVLPAVESESPLTLDREEWFIALRNFEDRSRESLVQRIASLFRRLAGHHRGRFIKLAEKLLGVDIQAVVREEDLEDLLRIKSLQNASLIKSLGAESIKRVEQLLYRYRLNEVSYENLSKLLREELKISRRRADLIATDQVQKLTADLNEIRQKQAGIEEYEWFTSLDERVRSRHKLLHGKVYKHGQKTGAEQGLSPGKPVRCRCTAIGIVNIPQ